MAFDALGYKLITGISLWACAGGSSNSSLLQQNPPPGPTNQSNNPRRDDSDDSPGGSRPQESPGSARDMIVNSYQNLVQRYDSLVRNYQRLFMVRHRLTNTPPPPPNTVMYKTLWLLTFLLATFLLLIVEISQKGNYNINFVKFYIHRRTEEQILWKPMCLQLPALLAGHAVNTLPLHNPMVLKSSFYS